MRKLPVGFVILAMACAACAESPTRSAPPEGGASFARGHLIDVGAAGEDTATASSGSALVGGHTFGGGN